MNYKAISDLYCLLLLLACATAVQAQTTNTFPTSGNVGIGTCSPTTALHIVGTSKLDGPLTTTSTVDLQSDLKLLNYVEPGTTMRLLGVAADGKVAPVGRETVHVHYLVVDSAIQIGDSSFHTAYVGGTLPANHLYSTFGAMVINGYASSSTENTCINPIGGQVGIGFGLSALPIGPKMAVNGNSYLLGYNGINILPATGTRLAINADVGEIGLQIRHLGTTPLATRIAQRTIVMHPNTRALSVIYDDGNAGTFDPETFVVSGLGVTKVGPINTPAYISQLLVETDMGIGCAVKTTNQIPGKIAYLAEVPRADSKAISIVRTVNAGSPVEVFKVTGGGVAWMQELRVRVAPFPDYVFEPGYSLMDLDSLEQFVLENHHLPGMPTAKEVAESDANIGELVRLQQEKIEELTLYVIELKKLIDAQNENK